MPTGRFNQGNVTAVRVPLLFWLSLAQSLWWRADWKGRWSGLASVPLVGLVSATVVCTPTTSLHVLKILAYISSRITKVIQATVHNLRNYN